jgi:MurNAc alpha-1-phosphate uridylyltransferase
MKAMILAAGRGDRMRPLTDSVPKPLLRAGDRTLIEHLVVNLVRAGFPDIVVNHAHLGAQIVTALGDGGRYGARIHYSDEGETGLETGGGIRHALHLLDSDPFLVVNGDIYTEFPFESLPRTIAGLAHLVLVPNPDHHPNGDFCLADGKIVNPRPDAQGETRHTYSGIGIYRRAIVSGHEPGKFPLAPLLRAAADRGAISGEVYNGVWWDIGTPARLAALDAHLNVGVGRKAGKKKER